MKNMRISLVLIFSAFHFALPFKLNAQDFFKECIHFKVKDTSSKVLPDYDTSYSGIYPHLQYIIDSLEVLNISSLKVWAEEVFPEIYIATCIAENGEEWVAWSNNAEYIECYFYADTELEATIKACEWILKEINEKQLQH